MILRNGEKRPSSVERIEFSPANLVDENNYEISSEESSDINTNLKSNRYQSPSKHLNVRQRPTLRDYQSSTKEEFTYEEVLEKKRISTKKIKKKKSKSRS